MGARGDALKGHARCNALWRRVEGARKGRRGEGAREGRRGEEAREGQGQRGEEARKGRCGEGAREGRRVEVTREGDAIRRRVTKGRRVKLEEGVACDEGRVASRSTPAASRLAFASEKEGERSARTRRKRKSYQG